MTFMTCLGDPGKTWVFGSLPMYKGKIPKIQHLFQDSSGRRTTRFIITNFLSVSCFQILKAVDISGQISGISQRRRWVASTGSHTAIHPLFPSCVFSLLTAF